MILLLIRKKIKQISLKRTVAQRKPLRNDLDAHLFKFKLCIMVLCELVRH